MQIEIFGKRVLVKPADPNDTYKGLSTPASSNNETKCFGEVVEVSPEISKIKVGDTIVFGVYTGIDIELDKEKFVILEEDEVIGKLNAMQKTTTRPSNTKRK